MQKNRSGVVLTIVGIVVLMSAGIVYYATSDITGLIAAGVIAVIAIIFIAVGSAQTRNQQKRNAEQELARMHNQYYPPQQQPFSQPMQPYGPQTSAPMPYPPQQQPFGQPMPPNGYQTSAPMPYPGYYQAPKKPTNGYATASLTLGIVGLVTFFFYIGAFASIIGLILGIYALRNPVGKGMTTWGIVLSAIGIFLTIIMLAYALIVIVAQMVSR